MAKKVDSKFLIIEAKASEFLAVGFGGGGETTQGMVTEGPFEGCGFISMEGGVFMCCDDCNEDIPEDATCYYVAVLNRVFCKDCFESWHESATYYPEDAPYEKRSYDNTVALLASKGILIEG